MAEEIPECCEDCIKWEQFGKDCWIYWEKKKSCTQKVTNVSDIVPLQ